MLWSPLGWTPKAGWTLSIEVNVQILSNARRLKTCDLQSNLSLNFGIALGVVKSANLRELSKVLARETMTIGFLATQPIMDSSLVGSPEEFLFYTTAPNTLRFPLATDINDTFSEPYERVLRLLTYHLPLGRTKTGVQLASTMAAEGAQIGRQGARNESKMPNLAPWMAMRPHMRLVPVTN